MFSVRRQAKEYTLVIYEEYCKGCGLCVWFCPSKALKTSGTMNRRGYYPVTLVDEARCTACGICELVCPDFAVGVLESQP